jgi:hypothetical protein
MADRTKIVLGPATVTVSAYGASKASGVNLGLTDGGTEFSFKASPYEVKVDQALSVVKRFKLEEVSSVKVNLAENSLANLAMAFGMPASAVVGSQFSFGGDKTLPEYTVYLDVVVPNGGQTLNFVLYLANVMGDLKMSYKKTDKTLVPFTIDLMEDISRTCGDRLGNVTITGGNTTAPTIVLTTPASGGTVTKATKGTVLMTITSPNIIDISSIIYGKGLQIVDVTVAGAPVLVAGTIAFDATAKTITFTPTSNWTASAKMTVVVGDLADTMGNKITAPYIDAFTVSA